MWSSQTKTTNRQGDWLHATMARFSTITLPHSTWHRKGDINTLSYTDTVMAGHKSQISRIVINIAGSLSRKKNLDLRENISACCLNKVKEVETRQSATPASKIQRRQRNNGSPSSSNQTPSLNRMKTVLQSEEILKKEQRKTLPLGLLLKALFWYDLDLTFYINANLQISYNIQSNWTWSGQIWPNGKWTAV